MSLAPLAPFCLPYFTQLSTLNISTSFVLFLADLLHPVDRFAVERLLNGDMSHRSGRRSAVPMLFTRRKPDHIARPDFLDRAAPTLNPPKAGREDQRLTEWMCMPGGAGARLKRDACAGHACRIGCLEQRINLDGTRKPISWPLVRRL